LSRTPTRTPRPWAASSPTGSNRAWLANRGIWEALPGAGPTTAVPATSTDVARYVNAYSELLAQLR
jgi:hypothetical protein